MPSTAVPSLQPSLAASTSLSPSMSAGAVLAGAGAPGAAAPSTAAGVAADRAATPVVELRGVGKVHEAAHGPVPVLGGIDLRLMPGDFGSVVGPSGCGKTTLLHLLGLLDLPSSGEYRLDGQPVAGAGAAERARLRNLKIGFVFQSFCLLPALSAQDNVAMPLVYRGVPRERARREAADMLAEVGLAQRLRHRPGELSGGQQQRVAIARALAGRPRLLLADEPTGNLDARTGEEVFGLFERVNRAEGTTILVVTHDAGVAARCRRRFSFVGPHLVEAG